MKLIGDKYRHKKLPSAVKCFIDIKINYLTDAQNTYISVVVLMTNSKVMIKIAFTTSGA